jgi:hypothetical protein
VRRLHVGLVLVGALALAGCQSPASVHDVNVPLSGVGGVSPGSYCVGMEQAGIVCLRPGLKLVVSAIDTYQKPAATRFLVQSRYGWLLPSPEHVSQEDLFNFSHLLAVSHSNSGFDPNVCYEEWLGHLGGDALGPHLIVPIEDSMRVTFAAGLSARGMPDTATRVQGYVRNVPAAGIASGDPTPRQTLQFEFPLIPGQPPAGTPAGKAVWYSATPRRPRTFVGVLIPIAVNGELGTRYVPFYYSVRDIERELGGFVTSISRDAAFMPTAYKGKIIVSDNRFSLHFISGKALVGPATVPVSIAAKPELLLAPGDVLFVDSVR